jgi:predicted HicB family RNase H-like nuclease
MTKPHGNTGKRNAAKPEKLKATGRLQGRVHEEYKAAWKIAAKAEKLSLTAWIEKHLNKAAGIGENET